MERRGLSGLLAVALMAVGGAVIARGEAKDDLKTAVDKLAGAANYAWQSNVEAQFGGGVTDGKTEKDGYTAMTMPTFDASVQVYMKGAKRLIQQEGGWKTAEELAAAPAGDNGFSPERFLGLIVQAFVLPAADLAEVAGKLENVKATADGFTADVNAEGAKQMLTFRRRAAQAGDPPPPQVSNAKATLKVTLKDGKVTQVVTHVTGAVNFNGNDVDVERTTTTTFKDVGATKVNVPEEVKKKLDA